MVYEDERIVVKDTRIDCFLLIIYKGKWKGKKKSCEEKKKRKKAKEKMRKETKRRCHGYLEGIST